MQLTSALRELGKTFVSASTLQVECRQRLFAKSIDYQIAHHEAYFEEIGCDSHQYVNFAEEIKIQRRHPVVIRNARKEIHENQLAIPLATIARFLVRCSFLFGATLDNDDSRCSATSDSCMPDFSLIALAQ